MSSLVLPAQLKEDFATVEAVWDSGGKTTGVDALVLSWIKYEKQLRRLFCFLVFQHPGISRRSVEDIISDLVRNRDLDPDVYIAGIAGLGVTPIPLLLGARHVELAREIVRIKKIRNKLAHGMITGTNIDTSQLKRDVQWIVEWVSCLADGATAEYGYNGLTRNTFLEAKAVSRIAVKQYPFTTRGELTNWLSDIIDQARRQRSAAARRP